MTASHGAAIPKLFNTGVDDSGSALAANTVDPHYTIVQIPDALIVNSNAFTLKPGFPVGPWIAEGSDARWIAPKADQSAGSAAGDYIYRTTFDLTGFDPTKASITGRWVSDNGGTDILLNGTSLGLSNPGNFGGWTDANNFTVSSGFTAGTNTLDFVVNNGGTDINPTGLRVELRGTVELPSEAPSIVVQPTGTTVIAGSDVQLTVVANGTAPLTYQWQLNGKDVAGATDATNTITGAKADQGGDYTVVVKNSFGSKTSAVAKVSVLDPIPGLFNTGIKSDGTVLDDGAIDPHYRLVVNADGTNTDAIVHDSTVFPIVSGPWLANSDISKWIAPQFDTTSAAGGDYVYRTSFDASDFDPTSVVVFGQWASDNTGLDILVNGASTGLQNTAGFGTLTSFTIPAGFVSGTNTLEFKLRNEGAGYTGLRVEGLRAGGKKKTTTGVAAPRIVAQPQGAITLVGDPLTLNVVADGTPPLNYQWKRNGQNVPGATASALVITNLAATQAGDYSVTISNAAGSIDSSLAKVTVLEPIPGLFNTGVDPTGKPLDDGATDPHFQLTMNAQDTNATSAIVEDSTVFPIVAGPWVANSSLSKWIGPQKDPNAAGGDYIYRTSFNIDGFDPATVRVTGQWGTDNVGSDILVNGTSSGIQNSVQFTALSQFILTNGFKTGLNTLDFAMNNAGADANPTGLRIEGMRAGAQRVQTQGFHITGVNNKGVAVSFAWSGGTPPYLVQKKSHLTDTNWFNVLTTTNNQVTVAREASSGVFRIQDQAKTTVLPFTALLSSSAESPAVTNAPNGFGLATLALETNQLSYIISFSDLSGPATAGHIHGPANALTSASPIIPFSGTFGSSGLVTGATTLTADQAAAVTNGLTYVNFHTAANPGGEIRGQIVPLLFHATLTGVAEVPPVNTTATATALVTLVGTQAFYDVDYANLSSDPTAAHLHGPADPTQSASPIVPLPTPTGTTGSIHASAPLTPQQLVYLLTGQTYLNIHTQNNGGGEIRGQVTVP